MTGDVTQFPTSDTINKRALLGSIRSASQAIQSLKESGSLSDLNLSNTSISVEYAVTSALNAEDKPVIQFVILDLAGSYSKNEVQSNKLNRLLGQAPEKSHFGNLRRRRSEV
jgi:hypothetical protein